MKKLFGIIFLLGSLSCSQVHTLNYNKHAFNTTPSQIIWFQIAGLSDEHLAFLKYSLPSSNTKIVFEDMSCSARLWNYNLYNLRPDAHQGFLSQLLGKKNIKGTCEDYEQEPIWDYLDKVGYQSAILESGTGSKMSLDQTETCQETSKKFLSKVALWRMFEGKSDSEKFHFSENSNVEKGKIYFDKSCRKENCYSSLFSNTQALYEKLKRKNLSTMLLIRDFSFGESLNRKEITMAKDRLIEIERTISYFVEKASVDQEMMVLVTSSAPVSLEFPNAGKNWSEFDKKGSQIIFHQTSLISPVYAYGARAENFCGLIEEAQVLERVLTSPQKTSVGLPFFN
ncbi:MAG: hypothetical protein ACOYL6_09625 [Bacteriovoracaceae bacterium]